MRKGYNKRHQEDQEVYSRCMQFISKIYCNKECPKWFDNMNKQFVEDNYIYDYKKSFINLENEQVRSLITRQGRELKQMIENDLLDYYII